jgi:hypothetical protein
MDMKKLERLSCLKIDESELKKIENSIDDVWQMIVEINKVQVTQGVNKVDDKGTVFLKRNEPMFDIQEKTLGLKNEEGVFEAPRVVHKKG